MAKELKVAAGVLDYLSSVALKKYSKLPADHPLEFEAAVIEALSAMLVAEVSKQRKHTYVYSECCSNLYLVPCYELLSGAKSK